MQWIIGAVVTLFALNGAAFGIQTGVYQMNGGSPIDCGPDVPKLLCGTPAYERPDWLDAIKPATSTSIGGYAGAAIALWNIATGAAGLVIALCAVDYTLFQGDPDGDNAVAGYLGIIGHIFSLIGIISCAVILIALANPIIGHLF